MTGSTERPADERFRRPEPAFARAVATALGDAGTIHAATVLDVRGAVPYAPPAHEVRQVDPPTERLPFADQSFDTVVSTFVLCTVRDPQKVFSEVARVLKQGGRFITLEHVRSQDPSIAKWQDRVTPVWKVLLGGCHPNRELEGLGENAGFKRLRFERFLAPQPVLAAPHIRAVWEKTA